MSEGVKGRDGGHSAFRLHWSSNKSGTAISTQYLSVDFGQSCGVFLEQCGGQSPVTGLARQRSYFCGRHLHVLLFRAATEAGYD